MKFKTYTNLDRILQKIKVLVAYKKFLSIPTAHGEVHINMYKLPTYLCINCVKDNIRVLVSSLSNCCSHIGMGCSMIKITMKTSSQFKVSLYLVTPSIISLIGNY